MNYTRTLDVPISDVDVRSEEEILRFWQTLDIYSQLQQKNKNQPKYIFHSIPYPIDVPEKRDCSDEIGAHLDVFTLSHIICRDVIAKYKAMSGFNVCVLPIWDYYHPAVERHIMKQMCAKPSRESGESEDGNVNPVALRERCREYMHQHINTLRTYLHQLGVFGDWENSSVDSESRYEFKIWDIWGELIEAKYLQKNVQPAYWCVRCHRMLNDEEFELRRYQSSAGYVKFPISEGLEEYGEHVYLLVQVDDLWMLGATVAVIISEESEYAIIEIAGEILIFATEYISASEANGRSGSSEILSKLGYTDYRLLKKVAASTLSACTCTHPLLNVDVPVVLSTIGKRSNTGICYVAPEHSPEDYRFAQECKLNITPVVDDEGILTDKAEQLCGFSITDVDKFIIFELKKRGYLTSTFSQEHLHPHCWMCHTPAIFRPVAQWFFLPQKHKLSETIKALKGIRFLPESNVEYMQSAFAQPTKWCVSRQRIWGVPIPVIYCKKCGYQVPLDKSIEAARKVTREKGPDAWFKMSASQILPGNFTCSHCGAQYFRKEDCVVDNHFHSILNALIPLTKNRKSKHIIDIAGEPTASQEWARQFILTIGARGSRIPIDTVHIRASSEGGRRAEPSENSHPENRENRDSKAKLSEEHSILIQLLENDCPTDILRLWFITYNDTCNTDSMEHDLQKLFAGYNDIQTALYSMLGNLTKCEPLHFDALYAFDKLVLERLAQLIDKVNNAYSESDVLTVFSLISAFCNTELNAFYLSAIKERLHTYPICSHSSPTASPRGSPFSSPTEVEELRLPSSYGPNVQRSAQTTLWMMTNTLVRLIAPVIPFFAEQVWASLQHLMNKENSSVFLADWPKKWELSSQISFGT